MYSHQNRQHPLSIRLADARAMEAELPALYVHKIESVRDGLQGVQIRSTEGVTDYAHHYGMGSTTHGTSFLRSVGKAGLCPWCQRRYRVIQKVTPPLGQEVKIRHPAQKVG